MTANDCLLSAFCLGLSIVTVVTKWWEYHIIKLSTVGINWNITCPFSNFKRLSSWSLEMMQVINDRFSDGCDYLFMLVLKLIHGTALDSSSLTDFHSWSECDENRGIAAVVKRFLWYLSQIQVYTRERDIVSYVKNIGTSGEKLPCYLDTTKTMGVCACLFSTTCSWLDLALLHEESSIISVCTMSNTWEYTLWYSKANT